MNRIDYISKITSYAARFVLEVEGFNAIGNYHINIHAESFLVPVLNEVLGLQLENLNTSQRKNFPAIDLADFKNRVAIQVTSTSSLDKIKSTLETFGRHNLHQQFDVLFIYVITEKRGQYNEAKIAEVIPEGFSFIAEEHIIDKDSILQKINAISATPKLLNISKLYEHEFSDVQIEQRKKKFESGYLNSEPENICPNMVRISFPSHLYKANLNIDEENITANLNSYLISIGKREVKKLKPAKLVQRALRENNAMSSDWILHENWLYTFRDLTKYNEPFRKIIDLGTITLLDCAELYDQNEAYNRVFKNLLRNTLMQLCHKKGIQWYAPRSTFRFANSRPPKVKQIRWKGKKESTKTVIFEMINKKEGHVICYRSLAFKASFLNFDTDWYMVINPTWSFTNPGGYHESRFESAYMSGIKRLENNNSVFNYFRFFSYYLAYTDLFTPEFPYLKLHTPEPISMSPSLKEAKWKPVKVNEKDIDAPLTDLQADTELEDIKLFEE
ncbi:SMEK domain-containing protein [Pontibacter sp. 172403-2]|uniref:SMEK domain-containing protein n=1 Tax=Pontibacter rufus TaxID=2791028 RepID=UPI0018AF72CA|nr:SMEK domain-containing protein [Pontibacter sp. 172403-2]MBF9254275.1 SMEK domain-containing protein [Pontibacter sp. 172403-2]